MAPWLDKRGAFAPFKTIVFTALFVPGAWLAYEYLVRALGPRPITEIVHESGLWAIRLLFITLAVTPLRQAWRWPELIAVRRMTGLAALAYASLHLVAYTADQAFDLGKAASEIVVRTYLTIGAAALVALVPLGVTSTQGMMRRLGGKRWRRLHQASYAIALLAVVHFFWQSKLDITEPVIMAGLYLWLMSWRLWHPPVAGRGVALATWLAAAALVSALLTSLGEAAYYHLRVGAKLERMLDANLSLDAGIRPGWVVFAICLAAAGVAVLRHALKRTAIGATRSLGRGRAFL